MIRTIVADDEPLARQRLRNLLKRHEDFELVKECRNGVEVIEAVAEERPDLLFLDVQMPDLDGFDALGKLPPEQIPVVVFVSAYDEYALAAFDAHALDYVLKPFDDERFDMTVARVREQIEKDNARELARGLLALRERLLEGGEATDHPSGYAQRISVRTGSRVSPIPTEDIDWIEAAGVYATLHARGKQHLTRLSLNELERRLDPASFVRIHRSTIVRVDAIVELRNERHGDGVVRLKSGELLRLSRRYRKRCEELLGL